MKTVQPDNDVCCSLKRHNGHDAMRLLAAVWPGANFHGVEIADVKRVLAVEEVALEGIKKEYSELGRPSRSFNVKVIPSAVCIA